MGPPLKAAENAANATGYSVAQLALQWGRR